MKKKYIFFPLLSNAMCCDAPSAHTHALSRTARRDDSILRGGRSLFLSFSPFLPYTHVSPRPPRASTLGTRARYCCCFFTILLFIYFEATCDFLFFFFFFFLRRTTKFKKNDGGRRTRLFCIIVPVALKPYSYIDAVGKKSEKALKRQILTAFPNFRQPLSRV